MPIMDAVSLRVVIALLEDKLQNNVSGLILESELKEVFHKARAVQNNVSRMEPASISAEGNHPSQE